MEMLKKVPLKSWLPGFPVKSTAGGAFFCVTAPGPPRYIWGMSDGASARP
jgi:hypothetical protein